MEKETPNIPNQKFYRFNTKAQYNAMKKKLDRLMGLPKGNTIHSIPPEPQKDKDGNFLLVLPRWIFTRQEKLDTDERPPATKKMHPVFNEEGEKIGEEEEELEKSEYDEIDRDTYNNLKHDTQDKI